MMYEEDLDWRNGYGLCPRCKQTVEDHDFIDGKFTCRSIEEIHRLGGGPPA